MAAKAIDPDILQQVLTDALPLAEEKATVESWLRKNPEAAPGLVQVYLVQKHRHKQALDEWRTRLRQAPWHPATFLRFVGGGTTHGLVADGRQRLGVAVAPEVESAALTGGVAVFLNADRNVLLGVAPEVSPAGSVAEFSRFHDGRAVLKSGEEEIVVEAAAMLRQAGLARGDLVLFDRDILVAFEKVEARAEAGDLLVELPADIGIEQLGGLDGPFHEVTREVRLHLFHTELVRRYRLPPTKGILLAGPPGVGKTSLVKAVTQSLARERARDVKAFLIRPGVHRSMWYGMAEQNVRTMFAEARRAAASPDAYVILFFDDVDQLGSREDHFANGIDARVLPAFLQEIDALRSAERVLLVGATNRSDLLDEALLRPGRFGDKVFQIPRPGRAAAREILRKYLTPELPYAVNGARRDEPAEVLIEEALSALCSTNSEHHQLATLTLRDGSRRPVTATQVLSGALIEAIAIEAKLRACFRALEGGPGGICSLDVQAAVDRALTAVAGRLRPGPALRQMLDLPADLDVVRVELSRPDGQPRNYEYLRLN